jgi:peptide/nickel transport system permease protein
VSAVATDEEAPPATELGTSEYAIGSVRRAAIEIASRTRSRFAAIVVALFALTGVFADVLASDLPLVCSLNGTTYVLPCVTRPRALDGWNNERLAAAGFSIAPVVAFGPAERTRAIAAPPLASKGHPLGTDEHGRDVFARLVHGTRTSLAIGGVAVFALVTIGSALGALAGFFGRRIDAIVSRLVDVLSSFPALVLLVVIQALQEQPSVGTLLLAIALTRWPEVARLVRAEVLVASSRDYAIAARALGASPIRVLWRHVIPNVKGPILIAGALGLAQLVVLEASLSFLRVGVPPPAASYGEMLSELRDGASAWWLVLFPGALVVILALALNVIGETLRDAFDPKGRSA